VPWQRLERDAYLTPGQIYRFELALAPRQWGLRPGHRLRLELTTQRQLLGCGPSKQSFGYVKLSRAPSPRAVHDANRSSRTRPKNLDTEPAKRSRERAARSLAGPHSSPPGGELSKYQACRRERPPHRNTQL